VAAAPRPASAAAELPPAPAAVAYRIMLKTILFLTGSNVFMTLAWYGHLKMKWLEGRPVFIAILVAWGIAFFEYCLQVPGNRHGYEVAHLSGYQLKVIQEVITLGVFIVFAWLVLGERLRWNYALSFLFMALAVYFAVGLKAKA
jgi:uncharacterized protein (DUF486 family)